MKRLLKRKIQKRTKLQWISYFKKHFRKNVLFVYPSVFHKLHYDKWKKFKRFLWKQYRRSFNKYRRSSSLIKTIKTKKVFFRSMLYQKQLFKILYKISSEKQLKKLLRQSYKRKKARQAFYSLIQRRLDFFLLRIEYARSLETARFLIKNNFIFINNRIITQHNYLIKCNDVLSIDYRLRKYIYLNLLRKKKRQILYKKKRRRRKKRNILRLPKIFEINYRTLDVILYNDFKIKDYKTKYDLNIDLIQKTYRR